MNILGVIFCLMKNHWWYKALAIGSGKDKRITLEGVSISYLRFTNEFTREVLLSTDHSNLGLTNDEADIITIPNLGWKRLNFFEVFG